MDNKKAIVYVTTCPVCGKKLKQISKELLGYVLEKHVKHKHKEVDYITVDPKELGVKRRHGK